MTGSTTTSFPRLRQGSSAIHVRRGPWGRLQRTPAEAALGVDDLTSLPRGASLAHVSSLRIGLGIDVHAFEAGVPLVLAGVTIEHPRGLAGHSDGDVIAHSLTDALLGAAGLADIGALFPSDDDRYRGADSLDLLTEAYRQVREAGFSLVNADCMLVGQEPRIAPYRDAMSERLASALGVERRPGRRSRHDDRLPRLHGAWRGARGAGGGTAPGDMTLRLVSHSEQPELVEREEIWRTWPAFMHHDPVAAERWDALYERFGAFQFFAVDPENGRDRGQGQRHPDFAGPERLAGRRLVGGAAGRQSTIPLARPSSPRCRLRSRMSTAAAV